MADTKISALTAATAPLDGTEQVPIVQGGATRRVGAKFLGSDLAIGAAPTTVTTFGDSIGGLNSDMIGGALRAACHYWEPGLNVRTAPRYNQGGSSSTAVATQVDSYLTALAGGEPVPDVAIIQTYQNDGTINSLANVNSFLTNVTAQVPRILATGVKLVIIGSVPPKASASQPEGRALLNSKLQTYCEETAGVVFWDWFQATATLTSTSTSIVDWKNLSGGYGNYSPDGTHPHSNAMFDAGESLAAILKNVAGKVSPRFLPNLYQSNSSVDSSGYSMTGPNGNFLGTNGFLNGVANSGVAGNTASLSDAWEIVTPSGVTVTPSIVVTDRGERKQRLALSGTPTADGSILLRLVRSGNTTNIGTKNWNVQCVVDSTNAQGIEYMDWKAGRYGEAETPQVFTPTNRGVLPTHTGRWFLRNLDPFEVVGTAGGETHQLTIRVLNGYPVGGTLDVSRAYAYCVNP